MERIVIDKINYFVEVKKYEVALCYYGKTDDTPFFPLNKEVVRFPICLDYKKKSLLDKLSILYNVNREIDKFVSNFKPDIIINVDMHLVRWLLPFKFKNIPKIIELHFSYLGLQMINKENSSGNLLKNRVNILLRRFFYPLYNKCIVLIEEDRKNWGFKNIAVIPNFTSLPQYPTDMIAKRSKTVVNVGRLFPQKNHILLIEAWGIVHQQEPEWTLEIWGEGKLRNELESKIAKHGLQNSVFLKGVSTNIGDVYRSASFFVLSSKYEGLPLVLIEALQFGLPCVCFAIDGTKGIIKDGINGFLVEEMTPEALANKILEQIRSNNTSQMSINAINSARDFDKTTIMGKWCKLFEELETNNEVKN